MAERTLGIARGLGGLLQKADPSPDGELLSRFLDRRDEEAFAALVRRHGPMVYSVCRRVLRHRQDAEDAFQATFLVLARRAGVVRPRSLVGNWLYGVAYRTALEARRAAAVRRAKESRAAEMQTPAPGPDEFAPDLREVLDRELSALPDVYRAAVIACDLEGLPRREAAMRLGWSEGTLSGRLARARSLLARRLSKHGVVVAGVGLGGWASAGVPPALADATARIGTLVAAGEAVALAAPPVAALTQGVMKAMLLTKLKTMTAAVMVGAAVLTTAAAGWRADAAPQDRATTAPKGEPPAAPAKAKPIDPDKARIAELERERDALLKRLASLEARLVDLETQRREEVLRAREAERRAREDADAFLRAKDAELRAREKEDAVRRAADPTAKLPSTPRPADPAPTAKSPDSIRSAEPPTPARPSGAPRTDPAGGTPSLRTPPPPANVPSVTRPAGETPPVRPPVAEVPARGGDPTDPIAPPLPAERRESRPGAAALLSKAYKVEDLAPDDKSAESLIRIIRATVEPKSWTMAGGEGGVEYFPLGKALVVRNTPEAHKHLVELLDMLRDFKAKAK